MKIFERLNKNEMKMIVGGNTELEGGEGVPGRCVQCSCPDGGSSCWYSKRSGIDLCSAVCGTSIGVNYLDPLESCSGCTLN